MIPFSSIRFKLTAWYLLCMIVILAIFGVGARVAMKASLEEAVDHDLRARVQDVGKFLQETTALDYADFLDELKEQALLGLGGGQVELWDGRGNLLFRSARLQPGQLGPPLENFAEGLIRYAAFGEGRATYRVASQRLSVNNRSYTIRTGEPMHEFQESIEQFNRFLFLSVPILLLLATAGGYALSKRALAPVDQITSQARSISITNLSSRLQVPGPRDELRRLALTLNEMLERLDSAVQRIVQFTGDASHELRTPLTLIHTAAEYSLRGERPREELLEGMRRILRESVRTTRLVNDLLLLARADEVQMGTLDLAHVARVAVEQARPLAEVKHIGIELTAPESMVTKGDEDSLTRALLILLDNAVKYTNEGGHVRVEVSGLQVAVIDTGIGIAKEDAARIWDRFWRADKVRSRNTGGSGLGLAIARSIAERHGASLDFQSEPGVGSRFTLRMPATPF